VNRKAVFAFFFAILLAIGVSFTLTGNSQASSPHKKTAGSDPPFAINVTAAPYSAMCDGVTDDTSAIQAALNAAPSTGARVQVPATAAGCKITSTLTIPQHTILEGETPDTLIWYASNSNGPAIQIGSTTASSPVDQLGGGLKDIGIIGNSSSGGLPNQVGVQISRALDTTLDNVFIEDTGIGLQVDGGSTGLWTGETTVINPMIQNVVTGVKFTDAGGTITDFRMSGGYIYGVSTSSGYGIYAKDLHSSQLTQYSVEHFNYGVYLDTGTQNNQFFGGRAESSGTKNGTHSYVCNGSGTKSTFWGPYDADVVTTAVTNTNSAACTLHS